MFARILLAICLVFSVLPVGLAQQTAPPPPPPKQTPASQKPPEIESQDVVKITTNLVQIDVSVTKGDKPVTDLQPEDFELLEDGKPQTITNFSYISNIPAAATNTAPVVKSKDKIATPVPPAKIDSTDQRRTIALVIDDLGISWESMSQVRTQVKKFIDELGPNDLLAIIRTGGDVGALQQFTNDKRVLQSAFDRLKFNPCSRAGLHIFQPVGSDSGPALCSQYVMNSTLNSLKFILQGMSALPGRKSMILLSDYLPIQDQQPSAYDQTVNSMAASSVDMNTDPESSDTGDSSFSDIGTNYYYQLQRLAEIAIRSSVVIYTVDTRGLMYTGLTAADRPTGNSRQIGTQITQTMNARRDQLWSGREGSEMIAKQTGGFLVRNSNDFGFKRILEDQQGYYLIGFRPVEETFNKSFHHIKARVKRSGLTVRTREGFYGFTSDQARPPALSATDAMNKALVSPFGAHDVSMRLTTFFIDEPKRGPMLRSFIYLDPRDLSFADQADGSHEAKVEIKIMLFGDNGRILEEGTQSGSVRILANAYERTLQDGITYAFDIPVKVRGGSQFRAAVRDVASNRVGSAGQFVDIPNLPNGRLAMSGVVIREESANGSATRALDEVATGPAVRRFHQGATVAFAFLIYNVSPASQLSTQMRLYRDGKLIFSPAPTAVSMQGQPDPQRAAGGGRLQLGSDMTAGDYVLQVIVTDAADKSKPRVTSQWIDFEIVK
jgi:VWFA-related protein